MFDLSKLFKVCSDAVLWASVEFSGAAGTERRKAAVTFAQDAYNFADHLIGDGAILDEKTDKWAKEVVIPNFVEFVYRFLDANPDYKNQSNQDLQPSSDQISHEFDMDESILKRIKTNHDMG